jgi:LmbE family N-acetylglucosaminyl deacetylase
MDDQLRLMCVMAHPDDETLGTGGILAKYAAEGVETYLVTATRGERGWFGDPDDNPGLDELGRLRTAELQAAAATLGLKEVSFLDYIDGDLDQADPDEAIRKIVTHIRRVRPQVVVTFDPGGAYGHPDHIAICQFTTAALVAAADSSYHDLQNLPPHRVLKLYYMMATKEEAAIYEEAFGDLVMVIDGVERRVAAWESWAITTRVDTSEFWEQVWDAVFCHKTQLPGYDALKQLPVERQQELWAANSYYRALSLVNGGRKPETDLFEGVREYQKRESIK